MKAVQTLTDGMIDYAGLFPPAKLPMAQALAEYNTLEAHTHRGMISRFVVPIARLPELIELGSPYFERSQSTNPSLWHFSVLAKPAPSANETIESLGQELCALHAFAEQFKNKIQVDSLEMALPEDVLAPQDGHMVTSFLDQLAPALDAQFAGLRTFLEISWKYSSDRALWALKNFNSMRKEPFYLKLRTGGLTPESIVPVEQLAKTIHQCREMQLGFKATAGLHEPFRHFDTSVGALLHGFVNLFTAAGLSFSKGISIAEISTILADENPAHFIFSDRTLKYLGNIEYVINTAELEAMRRHFVLGFGSCSFADPINLLSQHGLLGAPIAK